MSATTVLNVSNQFSYWSLYVYLILPLFFKNSLLIGQFLWQYFNGVDTFVFLQYLIIFNHFSSLIFIYTFFLTRLWLLSMVISLITDALLLFFNHSKDYLVLCSTARASRHFSWRTHYWYITLVMLQSRHGLCTSL